MTLLQTEPDHDRHLMTIALTARLDSGSGVKPLTPARFWKACAALGGDLADAAASGSEDLQSLAQRTTAAALHASELEGQGLSLLTPFHEHYPEVFRDRLGSNAPPLLYVAGDPARLAAPGRVRLGIVGSRDASEAEFEAAREAAEAAASRGWEVVSGGARGVDAVGLNAASAAGGSVVAIMSEGLRRTLRKGALRRLVTDEAALLVSAVHPDAGFSVGNAMARNKLIYALSTVTYVAAVVEGQGGTWNGAVEALRHGYGRVAVNAEAQAAAALQAQGAEVVNSVQALCSQVEAPPPSPAVSDEAPSSEGLQVTLFD
jgi:predicted Rossmann fold nucleotide-binding protein DprA/Smf involved in DNA uptake